VDAVLYALRRGACAVTEAQIGGIVFASLVAYAVIGCIAAGRAMLRWPPRSEHEDAGHVVAAGIFWPLLLAAIVGHHVALRPLRWVYQRAARPARPNIPKARVRR
jgi:hypothetical protein